MDQSTTGAAIGPLDESFAASLKQLRDAYVHRSDGHLTIRQAGAAYVGGKFAVPVTPFAMTNAQPAIETFVVRGGSPIAPTSENQELIDLWQPAAQRMADLVLDACTNFGIEVIEPGYLTVSALPLDQVSHEPHFDDDQYTPFDGVSIVAIVGSHSGTRTTTKPIDVPAVPVGAPISLPADVQHDFDAGLHPGTESEPERVVLFPQFGQLHSGPILSDLDPFTLRTLLVLRFRTVGIGPATTRRRRSRSAGQA